MIKFEAVSRLPEAALPIRKTAQSAGYDFVVAEDIIIPPYKKLYENLDTENASDPVNIFCGMIAGKPIESKEFYTLNEVADITKKLKAKPTLVSSGVKCALEPDTYLELSVRSSTPLKYWLILANGVGIIDADYYNNPDNEGEIFFQLINLSPFTIKLNKGDIIGQGIIKKYLTTDDDKATGERTGGFGSTSK